MQKVHFVQTRRQKISGKDKFWKWKTDNQSNYYCTNSRKERNRVRKSIRITSCYCWSESSSNFFYTFWSCFLGACSEWFSGRLSSQVSWLVLWCSSTLASFHVPSPLVSAFFLSRLPCNRSWLNRYQHRSKDEYLWYASVFFYLASKNCIPKFFDNVNRLLERLPFSFPDDLRNDGCHMFRKTCLFQT